MEKHFKKPVMKAIEQPLYMTMLQNVVPKDNINYINNILQGKNIIHGKHGILAKVIATRMSGEMNTSLANGWANYVVFRTLVEMLSGQFEGFVEGDDGIFASSVLITSNDYSNLGFDVKVNVYNYASEASFCGIISASDGTLVKEPSRFLENFGWTHSFISAGDDIMMELLRAKALSACYEVPQCPVLGAIARQALVVTRGYDPRFVEDGYHDTTAIPRDESKIPEFSPSPVARELFAKLYNVNVQTQLRAERLIAEGKTEHLAEIFPPTLDMLRYTNLYVAEG